jgi:tetratricopeptide (TPR) repeat protein
MTGTFRFALLVAVLLVALPVAILAQEPVLVIQKPAAGAAQTEADRKLAEIMKSTGGKLDTAAIVSRLEQFMRDNPTYPNMQRVYSYLLTFTSPTSNPGKALALADEAAAKFPHDSSIRGSALRLKFSALRAQKKDDAVRDLVQKLLESETDPAVLQSAASYSPSDSVKLLEKAIAERQKNPAALASPTLSDLRWSYALSLTQSGRRAEGLNLSTQVLEETKKTIADLQALPKDDPNRSRLTMLQMTIGGRYQSIANSLAAAGDYQKALDYIALAEQSMSDNPLQGAERYEDLRANIYAKMGRRDLELESYAKSFAARMDPKIQDKIRDLAAKNDKKPEEVFARAREIRKENAKAISPFELKTLDGQTVTLDSMRAKAKVILVNFFFPT